MMSNGNVQVNSKGGRILFTYFQKLYKYLDSQLMID